MSGDIKKYSVNNIPIEFRQEKKDINKESLENDYELVSIFNKLNKPDSNGNVDNILDENELNDFEQKIINAAGEDQNLSNEEAATLLEQIGLKDFNLNKFFDFVYLLFGVERDSETPSDTQPEEVAVSSAEEQEEEQEQEEENDIITYPKEGESFNQTAARLGFPKGSPEYEEFVKANPDAAKKGWFKVNEKIIISGTLKDKVNQDELLDETQSKEEVQKFNEKARAEKAAKEEEERIRAQEEDERIKKQKIEQKEKKTEEVKKFARQFYNIACNNHGNTSMRKMQELFEKEINADNIVEFIDAFQTSKRISSEYTSIIQIIMKEYGAYKSNAQTKFLNTIIDTLCDAAKKAGVSKEDIDKARLDFTSNLSETKEMEKAITFLCGAIKAKEIEHEGISNTDARNKFQEIATSENEQANKMYKDARDNEKYIAKFGDMVCGIFGCTTISDMDKKLGKYSKDIEKLAKSETEEIFRINYKEIFGIEFDPDKIAAREAALDNYKAALNFDSTVKIANQILNIHCSYDDLRNIIKHKFNYDDKTLDEIIEQYAATMEKDNLTNNDKQEILTEFLKDVRDNAMENFREAAQGKSLEQMKNDIDIITRSAFGTEDIVKDVIEFNQNQQITEMVTKAAFEIAGTVALQFVPGLGQMAAARIAASATKWGAKAIKIVKYSQKTAKMFSKLSKIQKGEILGNATKTAKVVNNTTRVGIQAANAGVATAGVDLSNGDEVKEATKKALMNMTFTVVGIASSAIAPRLMQIFGIEEKLAIEIAEEIVNAAGSWGVTSIMGEEYGSSDAFLDFATGLILSRLTHAKAEAKGNISTDSKSSHGTTHNEYDAYGRKIKTEEITPEGKTTQSTEYKYNDSENTVVETVKDSDGQVISSSKKEYDKNGNLLKEIREEDYVIETIEYDKNGNVVKTTKQRPDGSIYQMAEIEYDKNGNKIKHTKRNSEGNITEQVKKEYDKKGRLKKEIWEDGNGNVVREFEYDKKGNRTKYTERDSEGNVTKYKERTTDKKDRKAKRAAKSSATNNVNPNPNIDINGYMKNVRELIPNLSIKERMFLRAQMRRVKKGQNRWLNTKRERHILTGIKHKTHTKQYSQRISQQLANDFPIAEIPIEQKNLTDLDKVLLKSWYNNGNVLADDPEFAEMFERLGTVLKKDTTLYRCVTVRVDGNTGQSVDFLNGIKEGSIIDNTGMYTSTASHPNSTLDYGTTYGQSYILKINVPEGTKVLDMNACAASSDTHIMPNNVDEYVLPKDTKYKVISIDYNTNIVECELILP